MQIIRTANYTATHRRNWPRSLLVRIAGTPNNCSHNNTGYYRCRRKGSNTHLDTTDRCRYNSRCSNCTMILHPRSSSRSPADSWSNPRRTRSHSGRRPVHTSRSRRDSESSFHRPTFGSSCRRTSRYTRSARSPLSNTPRSPTRESGTRRHTRWHYNIRPADHTSRLLPHSSGYTDPRRSAHHTARRIRNPHSYRSSLSRCTGRRRSRGSSLSRFHIAPTRYIGRRHTTRRAGCCSFGFQCRNPGMPRRRRTVRGSYSCGCGFACRHRRRRNSRSSRSSRSSRR